jgi:transposase
MTRTVSSASLEQSREIEHLKWQLAKFRRWKFGQSAETLDRVGQMSLSLEALAAAAREASAVLQMPKKAPVVPLKPKRQPLPAHFDRIANTIWCDSSCPDGGSAMSDLGRPGVAEVLEVKTVTFTVTRHIRPKKCATIVHAPARPLARSYAGASLLALVLAWKYSVHLPLYRQCHIFANAGLNVSRTTLMQWVAGSTALLKVLAEACGRHVLAASNVHADDTPVRELAPGRGEPSDRICGLTCAMVVRTDREIHRRCGSGTNRGVVESIHGVTSRILPARFRSLRSAASIDCSKVNPPRSRSAAGRMRAAGSSRSTRPRSRRPPKRHFCAS